MPITHQKTEAAEVERMAAFDAGLCSLASVFAGGAQYERDIAEAALEMPSGWVATWLASHSEGRSA